MQSGSWFQVSMRGRFNPKSLKYVSCGYSGSMKYSKIFSIIFFIQLSIILFISIFWTATYGTSDDWMLDGWLNSTYTGEFEKESVFVSAIFSNLVSYLYSLQLSIAWYSIILMSITFVALTHWLTISILENILKKRYIPIIIDSSATIIFLLWTYIGITFTSTAIICAFVGLYSLVKAQIEINVTKINNFMGGTLLLAAYIIRPESLISAFALFAPLIILIIKRNRKINIQKLKNFTFIFLLFLATVIVNKYVEDNQSMEMKQYRTWVYKVQLFSDRPRLVELENVLNQAKWSQNDYHMFSDMIYFDNLVFDEKWLESGILATKDYYQTPNLSLENFKLILSKYIYNIAYLLPTLIGAIAYSLFLYRRKWGKDQVFLVISTVSVFVGIHVFLGIYMHNVPRVSIPIILGLLITLSVNWRELATKREQKRIQYTFLFLYFMSLLFTIINMNENRNIINQQIDNSIATSKSIEKYYSEKVVLILGRQEFNQMRNPYIYLKNDPNPNVMMIGNWDTFAPQWDKRLFNLNLDSENLSKDLLTNSNILWASQDFPEATVHILNFFSENKYGKYQFNKIATLPNKATLRLLSK